MSFSEEEGQELLTTATKHFEEAQYSQAETILNQLVIKNYKKPLVFHMLGTIFYDQGKFNKAIRSFRRALEVDPGFTDAGVGLSIILNDLGRYDEAKKVFEEAKTMLTAHSKDGDPYIEEKLALKHDELGELYFQYKRIPEAIEQFERALSLSKRKPELTLKIIECHMLEDQADLAIKALREIIHEYPEFHAARIRLGKIFYDSHQVPEAVEQWEEVLRRDAENRQAQDYLRLAQSIDVIRMEPAQTGV